MDMMRKNEFHMVYSVGTKKDTPREDYRIDKYDLKTMKQDVVAFTGTYVVIAEADEFWGGEKSKRYQSPVMIDPTWGRLYRHAKAAQKKTNDAHHSFFEGAGVRTVNGAPKTMLVGDQRVTVLELHLGS